MMSEGDDCVRLLPVRECIVEERIWLRGVELVSHLNYSQLERVRLRRPEGRIHEIILPKSA